MTIGERLHYPTYEGGNGDSKQRRLSSPSIGDGAGDQSPSHSTRLHRSDKITGQVSGDVRWAVVEAVLSNFTKVSLSVGSERVCRQAYA